MLPHRGLLSRFATGEWKARERELNSRLEKDKPQAHSEMCDTTGSFPDMLQGVCFWIVEDVRIHFLQLLVNRSYATLVFIVDV